MQHCNAFARDGMQLLSILTFSSCVLILLVSRRASPSPALASSSSLSLSWINLRKLKETFWFSLTVCCYYSWTPNDCLSCTFLSAASAPECSWARLLSVKENNIIIDKTSDCSEHVKMSGRRKLKRLPLFFWQPLHHRFRHHHLHICYTKGITVNDDICL